MCIRDSLVISPAILSASIFFALLFILSASFLACTYSSLAAAVLLFSHFLIFPVFTLIAFFTSSFHHGVCLFLVPPTHLLPRVFSATSLMTSCQSSFSSPFLRVSAFPVHNFVSFLVLPTSPL